jgi:hypothetical protein
MKKELGIMLSVFAIGAAVGLPAHAHPDAKKSLTKKDNTPAPAGFVWIEEDVSINVKDLPLALMDESLSNFQGNRKGEAAGDLKAAARVLRAAQANETGMTTKEKMNLSADNLSLIAKDLSVGSIDNAGALKERLAQVAYYQARAFRSEADAEWNRRQLRMAGHDLDAAATFLSRSIEWSGKGRSRDNDAILKSTQRVATKLMDGTGWSESEVRGAFSQFASITDSMGLKVLPNANRAAESPDNM